MSTPLPTEAQIFNDLPLKDRLRVVEDMMRQITRYTDPQEMVRAYGTWIRSLFPVDRFVSVSRRDLAQPWYRVTRSGLWEEQGRAVNPWQSFSQLPQFQTGIAGQLLYTQTAHIDNNWTVDEADPLFEHLGGFRSMRFMPLYDNGVAINGVIQLKREPGHFDPNRLANDVWLSNLFGRATSNLVLSDQLRKANDSLEREMKTVADIQRSLLPSTLPQLPGIDIAAFYQTSRNAGGDYYDFFELPDGKLGILIADVSGHGTPAAVIMAVTHSIAHTLHRPPEPPHQLLQFINHHLCARYTTNGTFVTAFYGIYNPKDRSLLYCSAGHNPPVVRAFNSTQARELSGRRNLPLGIEPDEQYADATTTLDAGDTLVIYTDGIVEARKPGSSDLLGIERLIATAAAKCESAQTVVDRIMFEVNQFTDGAIPTDDRTLVVMRVR
jgi:phosphoserine phosphatase RsbU/P